jgi:hypothetical protein
MEICISRIGEITDRQLKHELRRPDYGARERRHPRVDLYDLTLDELRALLSAENL